MRLVNSDQKWLTAFDEYAESFLAKHEVPGAAVSVVGSAGTLYQRGFGSRDREEELPATPATVFGIASLSKSFTALTTLVLQARGVLSVDDLVTDHLAGFAYPGLGSGVRIRHLLSHSTGLPPLRSLDFAMRRSQLNDPANEFNVRDYTDAPSVDDYEQLQAYLRRGERPALAPPGEVMSYSNEGVALVGAVIESATGEYFPDVLKRLVLEPLGMDSTTFDVEAARAGGELTTLYTRTPDKRVIRSPDWQEAPAFLGTGFLKSSADDLGTYLRALLDKGRALGLSEELYQELLAPRVWSAPGTDYCFAWGRRKHRGVTVVRHGGSLKGVSSHQGFVPELGLGVAILANLDEVPVMRLWLAALNLALGLPVDTPLYGAEQYEVVDVRDGGAAICGKVAGVYASGEPWGRLELVPDADTGAVKALVGEDAEESGRLAMLNEREFVLVTASGAWDGGRFHLDESGVAYAVQHGGRWYDRVADPADPVDPGTRPTQT